MKKIVLASLLAVASLGAQAQAYIGGGLGMSEVNLDCGGTTSCDKSDTGYKIYAGYKLNPMLALEAGYIDFGKAKFSGYEGPLFVTGDIKSHGFTFAAAIRGNFTPALSGVGRLGVAQVDTKVSGTVVGFGSGSTAESKAELYFGLGLEYAFTKNIKGVVSADFSQGEVGGESGSVRLIGAGVQYDF
jgi:OmpA-OmpF porin, OOP family